MNIADMAVTHLHIPIFQNRKRRFLLSIRYRRLTYICLKAAVFVVDKLLKQGYFIHCYRLIDKTVFLNRA